MLTWHRAKKRLLCELREEISVRNTAIYAMLAKERSRPEEVTDEQLRRELEFWQRVTYGLDHIAIQNSIGGIKDLAPVWLWLKRLILGRMVRALAFEKEEQCAWRRASYVEEFPFLDTCFDFLLERYRQLQEGGSQLRLEFYAKRIFEDQDQALVDTSSDQSTPPVEAPAEA